MSKEILIIDDTPENLRLLLGMLNEEGYQVRAAPSGKLALNAIERNLPDLILLDILMPEMDGFEVCRLLKANPETQDIPVIFISALNEVFDKMEAFHVGGVDYITKPFQVEEVLARINLHLSLRELQQDLEEHVQELKAFSRMVAHDLKNPVASLIGILQMILTDDHIQQDPNYDVLKLAVSSAYKINNIIDEILLLVSIRKEEAKLTPLEMDAIVDQALIRLQDMIDKYQPEIIMPDTWLNAMGYGPWIEEIWVNYLSNGLKYGGRPPVLELGSDLQDDNMIRFWVKDNGTGISPEDKSRLFVEFTRLNKNFTQGHGLGLSIVQRIVDKLDGEVGVEILPEGGSLFYFKLPSGDNS